MKCALLILNKILWFLSKILLKIYCSNYKVRKNYLVIWNPHIVSLSQNILLTYSLSNTINNIRFRMFLEYLASKVMFRSKPWRWFSCLYWQSLHFSLVKMFYYINDESRDCTGCIGKKNFSKPFCFLQTLEQIPLKNSSKLWITWMLHYNCDRLKILNFFIFKLEILWITEKFLNKFMN